MCRAEVPAAASARRQHPLGGSIADFHCAEGLLVVEVDGGVHEDPDQRLQDEFRDAELRGRGVTVLRFTNAEIDASLERALTAIAGAAAGGEYRTHHR
jgi:very-short-patch-repair endonuclease